MKKKIISIVLAVLLIMTLASCELATLFAPKIPSMNFKTDAVVKYKTYEITCEMENVAGGALTVDIEEPVILSGLKMVCENGKVYLKLGSLSYDTSTVPQAGFGNVFADALNAVKENSELTKNDDGTWTLSADIEAGHMELILDGETGYPKKLTVDEAEIEVIFSNFTETDKENQ